MHAVDAAISAVPAFGNTWGCYRIVPTKTRPEYRALLLGGERLVLTELMGERSDSMEGSALPLVLECK